MALPLQDHPDPIAEAIGTEQLTVMLHMLSCDMRCAVLCCAVLCCAVLCCAVLCCAVLCCDVMCCAVLCCAVLCVIQCQHTIVMRQPTASMQKLKIWATPEHPESQLLLVEASKQLS